MRTASTAALRRAARRVAAATRPLPRPCLLPVAVVRPHASGGPLAALLDRRCFCQPAGSGNDAKEPPGEPAAASAAAASGEGCSDETGGERVQEPCEPQTVWTAPTLFPAFESAERDVGTYSVATGGGIGLALLGIAPHLAPNPFMVAMLLAAVQMHIAYAWQLRTLRAQLRRNVTEIIHAQEVTGEGENAAFTTVLSVTCDGGVSRTLRLIEGEGAPSFEAVIRQTGHFIFIDRSAGHTDAPETLDSLLKSDRIIDDEELTVEPVGEESQQEADKVVQRLAGLKASDLKTFSSAQSLPPSAALQSVARSSQLLAGVTLLGGAVICAGGRREQSELS